ncbi:hypothetical protein AAF712_013919 [Marasmius tenuissimus]|uniref:Uncharacterized protein n=1 Tax=Marasmius tenuissimus TaxID=585030 RepID=A0ABR2ZEH6_9AGAR
MSNRYALLSDDLGSELTSIPDSKTEDSDWDTTDEEPLCSSPTPAPRPSRNVTVVGLGGATYENLTNLVSGMLRPPPTRAIQQPLPMMSSEPDLVWSSPIRGNQEQKTRMNRQKGQAKRLATINKKGSDIQRLSHPHTPLFDDILSRLASRQVPVSEFFFYVFDPVYKQGQVRWHGFLQTARNVTRTLNIFSRLKQTRDIVRQWAINYTAEEV